MVRMGSWVQLPPVAPLYKNIQCERLLCYYRFRCVTLRQFQLLWVGHSYAVLRLFLSLEKMNHMSLFEVRGMLIFSSLLPLDYIK